MEIQAATTIDRPVSDVWRWYAVDHVTNHPRWDPDMELQQVSHGPIGLGTRIRRRNARWGEAVEGEMEVVEWEPERAMGVRIHDANMDMQGRVTLQEEGPSRTVLTITTDIPEIGEEQAEHISAMMQRSAANMKRLAEEDL